MTITATERHAPRGSSVRALPRAALFGAVTATVVLLLLFIASNVQASLTQRSLRDRWNTIGANTPVKLADPIAQLLIPAIGLDLIVAEGAVRGAPSHLPSSAMPGKPGLSVIDGGRFAFGAVFGPIDRLRVGDEIVIVQKSQIVRYRVTDTRRIDRSAIDHSSGGDAAMLLLVAPADRVGGSDRLVVRAREIS